jgi:ABC-type nitrate/sulfonate/bicarbonate transport system substrate-binding protein
MGPVAIMTVTLLTCILPGCKEPVLLQHETIHLADPHFISSGLIYLADSQNYFAESGITLDLQQQPSGKEALLRVLDNRADIAIAYLPSIVIQAMEGKPVNILGSLHRSLRNTALVARHDRGIRSLSDLKGKRIGYLAATNLEYFILTLLLSEGIKRHEVSLVDIPRNQMKEAIKRGDIDGGVLLGIELVSFTAEMPPDSYEIFYSPNYAETSLIVTNDQFLKSQPKLIKKFLSALMRAEEFRYAAPEKSDAILIQRFAPFSPQHIKTALAGIEMVVRLDNITLNSMDDQARLLRPGVSPPPPSVFHKMMQGDILRSINPLYVTYLTK